MDRGCAVIEDHLEVPLCGIIFLTNGWALPCLMRRIWYWPSDAVHLAKRGGQIITIFGLLIDNAVAPGVERLRQQPLQVGRDSPDHDAGVLGGADRLGHALC